MSTAVSADLDKKLRDFYRNSDAYAEHLAGENEAYFKRYLSLIDRYGAHAETVLDAGCGTGLSTCLLSRKKKYVVGLDLSELFMSRGGYTGAKGPDNADFCAADILRLPFKSECFDLVASYLVMEFLPDAAEGLSEMARVLKKEGILIVIAPNLLSPVWPFRDLLRMFAGGPSRPVWCDTAGKAAGTFWRNLSVSIRKSFQKNPRFLYRSPDLSCDRVVGRDSDSVYLAHPLDIASFLKKENFRILRTGSKSGWLERRIPSFAVSVEVVAQKK